MPVSSSSPAVLYADYNGVSAALSELYWSSSSSVLVSRHPLSSVEEIISLYCSHCLTRLMEDEARNYHSRCPSCFQCPKCNSVLVTVPVLTTTDGEVSKVALGCSACLYRSDQCGLVGADKQEIDALVMERERESAAGDAYAKILSQLQSVDEPVSNASTAAPPSPPSATQATSTPLVSSAASAALAPWQSAVFSATSDSEVLDYRQRAQAATNAVLMQDCPPSRLGLRSKRTLRCRLDVERGKMSILLQPKTFPLEGDSSLKIQRGKWWVKDASAIHEVPRVIIARLPVSGNDEVAFLHLEVSNPKDVPVRLALSLATAGLDEDGLTLEANSPSSSGSLELSLGAFEDELLREVDADSPSLGNHKSAAEELQSLLGAGVDRRSLPWLGSVSHNTAAVIIPLRMKPSINGKKSELPLSMTVVSEAFTRCFALKVVL